MHETLERLNRLRLEEDLTYGELAEGIGIETSALNRLLRGENEPLDRTVFKIQRFLDSRPEKSAKRRATA